MARRHRRFTPNAVDHGLEARLALDAADADAGEDFYPSDFWAGPLEIEAPPLPADAPPAFVGPPEPEPAEDAPPHVDDPFEDPFADPVDHNPGGPNPADSAPGFPPDE